MPLPVNNLLSDYMEQVQPDAILSEGAELPPEDGKTGTSIGTREDAPSKSAPDRSAENLLLLAPAITFVAGAIASTRISIQDSPPPEAMAWGRARIFLNSDAQMSKLGVYTVCAVICSVMLAFCVTNAIWSTSRLKGQVTIVLLAVHLNTLFFNLSAAFGYFRPIIINDHPIFVERTALWIGNTLCLIMAAGLASSKSPFRNRTLRRALLCDFAMLSMILLENITETYPPGSFEFDTLRKLLSPVSTFVFAIVVVDVKRLYDIGASECLLVSDARHTRRMFYFHLMTWLPYPIARIAHKDLHLLSDLAYDAVVAFSDVFSVGLFSVLLLFGVFLNQDQISRVESLDSEGIMESALDKVRSIEAANRELSAANDSMVQTMRLQRAFLANASHELRTPLNAIMGLNSLMLEDPDVPPLIKDYVHASQVSADVLLGHVTNLLEFARLEGGSAAGEGAVAAKHEEFNLCDLLCELLEIIAPRAERKGVQLVVDVAEPDLDSLLLVGDPFRIRQALINVVENAIKFASGLVVIVVRSVLVLEDQDGSTHEPQANSSSAHGRDRPSAVRARSKSAPATSWCFSSANLCRLVDSGDGSGDGGTPPRAKRMLEFAVTDDGRGIAPHHRTKLFRAFMQISSDDGTKHVGQGLGLVISSRILQSLGGTIEIVDSAPGEGAKFALRVPLEEAPAPADAASNDAVSEVTDAFADWAEGDPNEPLLPVFVAFRAPQAREAALRVIRSWGASQAGAWDLPHCPVPSRSDSGSGANLAEGADMTSPAGFSSPAARAVSAAVLLHLATRTTEREAAEMLITKLEADAGCGPVVVLMELHFLLWLLESGVSVTASRLLPIVVGSKDARDALRNHSDALRDIGVFDIEAQFVLEPLRPMRSSWRTEKSEASRVALNAREEFANALCAPVLQGSVEGALEHLMDVVAAQHAPSRSRFTSVLSSVESCASIGHEQRAHSTLAHVPTLARVGRSSVASDKSMQGIETVVPEDAPERDLRDRRGSLERSLPWGRPAHEGSLFGVSRERSVSRASNMHEEEAGVQMGSPQGSVTIEQGDDSAQAGVASRPSLQGGAAREQPKVTAIMSEWAEVDCLVVEDNAMNQRVAVALLRAAGVRRIRIASDGAEGVAVCRGGPQPELIFMDLQMPVLGGVDAAEAIRTLEKERRDSAADVVPATETVPCSIVALTANTSIEDREDCFRVGMDSFVTKPVTAKTIRQELAAHSQRRKAALAAAGVVSVPGGTGEGAAGSAPLTSAVGGSADSAVGTAPRVLSAGSTWVPNEFPGMEDGATAAAGGDDGNGGDGGDNVGTEIRATARSGQHLLPLPLPQAQPQPPKVSHSGSSLRQAASTSGAASLHGAPAGVTAASLSHYEYGSGAVPAHHGKHQRRLSSHSTFRASLVDSVLK